MECHKREFVAAAQSQGTQLDPSLLVNEGSQAEQIEAGDVFCRAISMSKGFWLNHVEPTAFDRVFEDYLWLQKMVQISTSTHISPTCEFVPPSFHKASFPLSQNQPDLVLCFSGLYWSSRYRRCCFTTNLQWELWWFGNLCFEIPINHRIGMRSPWDLMGFSRPSQTTKESLSHRWDEGGQFLMRGTLNPLSLFDKYWVFRFLVNTASPGVAEFWVKLMDTNHRSTSSSVKQHGFMCRTWSCYCICFKWLVSEVLTKQMTPIPKMLGIFSLSTRGEGFGVCFLLFPGYVDEPFLVLIFHNPFPGTTSTKDGYDANDLAGFRQVRFNLYCFHYFVFIFAPRTKTTCRPRAFISPFVRIL